MSRLQGVVGSVRVDDEKFATVLRFVVTSGEDTIPVEMRGLEVRGVLEVGHEVAIETAGGRDADGVLRPRSVENLTTGSRISVSRTLLKTVGRLVVELGVASVAGVLSTVAATLVMEAGPQERGVSSSSTGVAVAIGLGIGVFVFYLINRRRRSR